MRNEKLFWIVMILLLIGVSLTQNHSTNPIQGTANKILQGNEALSKNQVGKAGLLFEEALRLHPGIKSEIAIAQSYLQHVQDT